MWIEKDGTILLIREKLRIPELERNFSFKYGYKGLVLLIMLFLFFIGLELPNPCLMVVFSMILGINTILHSILVFKT